MNHIPLNKILQSILVLLIFAECLSAQKDITYLKAEATETVSLSNIKVSLAQWSLHRSYYGENIQWEQFAKLLRENPDSLLKGALDPIDFPEIAASYGIYCIELVNTFYYDKAKDTVYLNKFKENCEKAGVEIGLIMCDHLGDLGDPDPEKRMLAVRNHFQWVDAAMYLGAHSIRVNASGSGKADELALNVTEALKNLAIYAQTRNINILVENHGGYSSDAKWLINVIKQVDMDNVGTLPDFGNFCIESGAAGCVRMYDRYQGMKELLPYAKGISAKSRQFDETGNETETDFFKMLNIIKSSGYNGYIGIEYEGDQLTESEGIFATQKLLEKISNMLNSE